MITTWVIMTMRTSIMIKMDLFVVEWRCVLEGGMGQCVMTPGTMMMPLWSAINLDYLLMVIEVINTWDREIFVYISSIIDSILNIFV